MKWDCAFTIAMDHPSLPGHFPGNPIVPGVVILDEVVSALRARLPALRVAGFAQVKFLAPLSPNARASVTLEQTTETQATFRCHARDTLIATGTLRLTPEIGQ